MIYVFGFALLILRKFARPSESFAVFLFTVPRWWVLLGAYFITVLPPGFVLQAVVEPPLGAGWKLNLKI